VVAADYDGDGKIDLFIGGRVAPGHYGRDPESLLLHNDGTGHFTNVTATLAPELQHIGMVTDAIWKDVTGDGKPDLIVVGEWMPVTIFKNMGGGKLAKLPCPGLEQSHGWWNRILAGDFTGHGRTDLMLGNLGLNGRLHASEAEPTIMYVKDFANNGFDEQIVTTVSNGKRYPIVLRDDMIRAIPALKARYRNYADYATQTVTDIFPAADLAKAVTKTANTFESAIAASNGDGTYTLTPLPREVQLAPVYGMLLQDVDGDGKPDLLVAGNFTGFKPDLAEMASSYGLVLHGDGKGGFTPIRTVNSGFLVPGQSRDIRRLRTRAGDVIMVVRNNDRPLFFRTTSTAPSTRSAK
jgi:hypothetical protein